MRLFVVVFLALATAISVNALYLQDAPRFAGTAVSTLAPEAGVRSASSTASLPKKDTSALPSATAEDRNGREAAQAAAAHRGGAVQPVPEKLVRAIQRELDERGYAAGRETGNLYMATRTAIIAYEFDQHMPLTGEPSESILKSLIFGRPGGEAGPGSEERFERRRDLVAAVQDTLARLGYSSGPIDGHLDARTRDAIRRFEADRNLRTGGRLTERVLLEIVTVTGKPLNADG